MLGLLALLALALMLVACPSDWPVDDDDSADSADDDVADDDDTTG